MKPPAIPWYALVPILGSLVGFGACGGVEIPVAAWCLASSQCVVAESLASTETLWSVRVASRDPSLPPKGRGFAMRPEPGQQGTLCQEKGVVFSGLDRSFRWYRHYAWLRRDPADASPIVFRVRRCITFPWLFPI